MLSVVVPVFNEEESLSTFYSEIKVVLEKLDEKHEIIFIDDGSTDSTLQKLKDLSRKDSNIRIFSLRKNSGKSEGLSVGFQKAKGDYIFTIDVDLEEKPSEFPRLLKIIDEGYDIVSGWRKNRKHSLPRVYSSKIANSILSKLWGLELHDINCGLKVYTRDAAKSLLLYGGLYRFIPLIAHLKGFRVSEIVVDHENRKFGNAKYGFLKLWKDLPDAFTVLFLTKYAEKPLHFFGFIGGLVFSLGFLIFFYLGIIWLWGESIGRRPLFFTSIFLMLGGIQIFFSGVLAELIRNNSQRDYTPQIKYSSDV